MSDRSLRTSGHGMSIAHLRAHGDAGDPPAAPAGLGWPPPLQGSGASEVRPGGVYGAHPHLAARGAGARLSPIATYKVLAIGQRPGRRHDECTPHGRAVAGRVSDCASGGGRGRTGRAEKGGSFLRGMSVNSETGSSPTLAVHAEPAFIASPAVYIHTLHVKMRRRHCGPAAGQTRLFRFVAEDGVTPCGGMRHARPAPLLSPSHFLNVCFSPSRATARKAITARLLHSSGYHRRCILLLAWLVHVCYTPLAWKC